MALEIEIARVCHHAPRAGRWTPSREARLIHGRSPEGAAEVALEKCAILQARWQGEREAERKAGC